VKHKKKAAGLGILGFLGDILEVILEVIGSVFSDD